MHTRYDVIVIGSGPAGVSATFPLLEKGLSVLMVDGGAQPDKPFREGDFLESRSTDKSQWKWMLGENYHALKMQDAVSPKLRVPGLAFTFKDFSSKNHIENSNFIALGSLASGGLSNAWGAGVARFSAKDLARFPFEAGALDKHYGSVCRRIGVSGKSNDDLANYFGVDESAQQAVAIDENNSDFFHRYSSNAKKISAGGFLLGRSRVAVLTENLNDRKACALSGNCLWGCAKRSIYSASDDLELLKKYANFSLLSGFVVDAFSEAETGWVIHAKDFKQTAQSKFEAKKIILAAGTLATTRLALKHLSIHQAVPLYSSPTAAFIVWNYRRFGAMRKPGFGLGQLSFTIDYDENIKAFGSTFATTGIPVSEFAKRVPLSRPFSIDVLSALLSSCVIGNLFLPGDLTRATATLKNDQLIVSGEYLDTVPAVMKSMAAKIRKSFFSMGGVVLPGSFTLGAPGSDIHYAGTLPMSLSPTLGQCSSMGELSGTQGIYIVDGACLPYLPEKSHTLTIMANAERIGTFIANGFVS